MGDTRTETKSDEEIARDPSRHPNERESARGRLIDRDNDRRASYDRAQKDRRPAAQDDRRPAAQDDQRPLQNPPGSANTPGNG